MNERGERTAGSGALPGPEVMPVTDALGSRLVVVTDGAQARAAGHDLVAVVTQALEGGAGAVLLREKHLAPGERLRLAEVLRSCTEAAGATLHVAGDAALARAVGADGVHLSATDPWPRAGERVGLVLGRSCHTVAELTAARATGARPGHVLAGVRHGLEAGLRPVAGAGRAGGRLRRGARAAGRGAGRDRGRARPWPASTPARRGWP